MELFRGYVKTIEKKCTQKFKNGEKLLTIEQAKNLEEYAGIIADDIILIDIDDMSQSEKLMDIVEELNIDCYVFQTTRGRHFFFKNGSVDKCYTHTKLACGLIADIKVGCKNSYSILKYKNKEREKEWEPLPNKELETIPFFLLPVKSEIDLLNMDNGDGRNQTLFNYILTLQNQGFVKDDIKKTLMIINKFIFSKPLPKSELETIMRDESFPEVKKKDKKSFFDDKGTFKFDEFSKYLLEVHKIIKINDQLHIYNDGIYNLGYDDIQAEMIKHISCLNKQKRSEVMSYLDLLVRQNTRCSDADWIAFNNGLFNIETDEFIDFSPNIIVTNKIHHDYIPEAYSEIADKTLNKLACNNSEVRNLLEEVIGYCFYRRNELRKAFILTGEKRNGKSTYLDMINQLLGNENTVALDLKELGDRFKTAELFGKLANIGDDIGDEFIANSAVFKKVVSGDRINAERKGQDPFDFSPYAKQLFSANSIPRIKDKSGAVIDRLIIVPFDASFSKDDPDYDPYIKYKLRSEEVMQYLINIGIQGLKRVLDKQVFSTNEKIQSALKEYEENNNPILLFFQEIEENEIMNNPTKFAYQKYKEFCLSNSFQELSNIEFSKQVKKYYDCEIKVVTLNGKSQRIYYKD